MSIIIEITSTAVQSRNGIAQRTNKPYSINEQVGYMHKPGQAYPEKIKINLENGQPPYAPGNYNLTPESYYVDKFGSIAVRPILVARPAESRPIQQAAKA